jgi:DHA3 family tetracycline resistance protein-like MFS transporter
VLFALFAGVMSDRFERRKVLIVADLLRGIAVAAMGLLSALSQIELWHIVALSVVFGIGESLFGPAFTALVPDLVPRDELAEANAVDTLVRPLGLNLFGPALGGLIIAAAGPGPALLLDAASFAMSIAALLLMRPHPLAAGSNRGIRATLRDVAEGLNYVKGQTWLWGTLVAALSSLLFFMGPMRVLVPFVVKNRLDGTAADLGLVFAAGGVGSVLASLAFSQRGLPARPVVVMFVAWGIAILMVAGFGLATALWQVAVVSFATNGLAVIGQLIWATLVGLRVPRELLGRVSSLDWMLSIGLVPVSYVATGPVAEAIGVSLTLILAGVLGGAIFLGFLLLPGIRDPSRGPQTASSSPSRS